MRIRIEADKLLLTLDFSIKFDEATGGFLVAEKDGDADHEIHWGPMPFTLVDAFIAERYEYTKHSARRILDQMIADMRRR